jgi:hypothetical protein
MSPTWASFYILCPIPGTEQYDDFLAEGLITETNLDRFDTTCLTWRHPSLSPAQLSKLLFTCYRQFFSWGHALRNLSELSRERGRILAQSIGSITMSLFTRFCTWRHLHPMSGGMKRVRLDCVTDYIRWRKETYGFEYAPLPSSLHLPGAESLLQPRLQAAPAVESAGGG